VAKPIHGNRGFPHAGGNPGKKNENIETFEKRSILFKAKEGENFNHPREMGFAFHRASRNTLSISRIALKVAPYGLKKCTSCKMLSLTPVK
jgi:hypothetical protein